MTKWIVSGLILFVLAIGGKAFSADGNWELLGRREVDLGHDHDRIDVSGKHERLRQLELRVEGAPVEIHRMVVTLGSDQKWEPQIRHKFEKNSRSHAIDLPGDRREIKRIDFDYASLDKRGGKAVVSVYGR
jgi:hypothetical protein